MMGLVHKVKLRGKFDNLVLAALLILIVAAGIGYPLYKDRHNNTSQTITNNNDGWPCGYQAACSSELLTVSPSSSTDADIDCSSYYDPRNDPTISRYDALVKYEQLRTTTTYNLCSLKCSITELGLLAYQSKGIEITPEIYEKVIVKEVKDNNCGTPPPYCVYNPSVPCPSTFRVGNSSSESGFAAGYEYAEKYQICDPDYDSGNSESFNNGVHAWTEDNC